jgi:hypothetical protein
MQKIVPVAVLVLALALPPAANAQDDEVASESVEQINAMLSEMQVHPSDIEADDGGYELDDVMCADGQYDIDLDSEMDVTNKRKE